MGICEQAGKLSTVSVMAERRKSSKPIMEKRRRERINNSLNELKNLLLETRKKDSSCCSKLEKADILEMTVQHLKSMRTSQENGSTATDPVALAHYRAGFNQSAAEISRYLVNDRNIEMQVRTRLLTHLSNTCHAVLSAGRFPHHPVSHFTPTSPNVSHFTPTSPNVSNFTLSSPDRSTSTTTKHDISYFTPTSTDISHFTPTSTQLSPLFLRNPQTTHFTAPVPASCPPILQPVLPTTHAPGPSLLISEEATGNPHTTLTSLNPSSQIPDDSTVWRPW